MTARATNVGFTFEVSRDVKHRRSVNRRAAVQEHLRNDRQHRFREVDHGSTFERVVNGHDDARMRKSEVASACANDQYVRVDRGSRFGAVVLQLRRAR